VARSRRCARCSANAAREVDAAVVWACCLLPSLSLEVFEDRVAPCAVIDGPAQRAFVHAPDADALAAGVRVGQPLAAARASCATLQALRRDPAAEAMRLQTLALHAYGCSSQVVLLPPDALLLEVGASLRLFGGWPAIRTRLRERIAAEGHALRLALAPTPQAARLFAALRDGSAVADPTRLARRLDAVPLADSRLPLAAQAMLGAVGVRTLGEARRLPASALARRAGAALVTQLGRLYGDAPDPQSIWLPAPRFELRCEFEYGIETSPALRFPLQRLMRELARHLHAREAAVLRFTLRFGHEGQPASTMTVGLRAPLRSADALFDAARTRLERHALAAPAHWLELVAEDLPAFAPPAADLFDAASRGTLDWNALVERLRARLGDEAVNGVRPWPDHRPEFAWRRGEHRVADATVEPASPRPTWLLLRPQPLRERIARFIGAPERIESGWWDGIDARRDYVVADLANGQRAWLFREAGNEGAPWMVHGWFG
jgi:protein ImuB